MRTIRRAVVKNPVPGGAVDIDALNAAVAPYAHGQDQAARQFALGRLGIVQRTDTFDLDPPVFHVAGETVFLGPRAKVLSTRGFLLYSSVCRAISPCRRAISSALLIRSRPLGAGSGAG